MFVKPVFIPFGDQVFVGLEENNCAGGLWPSIE
jgi:hypothetical protein